MYRNVLFKLRLVGMTRGNLPNAPGSASLRFQLLGDFEVFTHDRSLNVGQPKQRALLGMLALRRKTVVTVSAIVDALWPDAPPARVRNQIQGCVAGLRRLLGSGAVSGHVIRTRTGGYLLDVPADWVDLAQFEETAALARQLTAADRLVEADHMLRTAMAMWRRAGD